MALGERLPMRSDGSIGATRPRADPTLTDLLGLIRRPAWMRDALCREYPQVSWFPEVGQNPGPAKAICARCAVAFECRQFGLEHEGYGGHGVYGGLSRKDRSALGQEGKQEPAA